MQILDAPIVLPDPPSLTALRNKGSPYYRFLLTIQGANAHRQLANYLAPADAQAADSGGLPVPTQWASAFTLAGAGGRLVTQDEFLKEFLPVVEASIATPEPFQGSEMQKSVAESADKGIKQLNKELGASQGKLRLDQNQSFGVYARGPSYFVHGSASVLRVEQANGTASEVPVIGITGFMLVKQRLFSFVLCREYREPRDIARTKADAVAWAEAIARANQ